MVPSSQVRSVFAQVVISMAGHHYLSVEGGRQMIEFVVKQCAMDVSKDPGKSSGSGEVVTPRQLRDMNDHVLRMISTTIPHMDEVHTVYILCVHTMCTYCVYILCVHTVCMCSE